MTSKLCHGPSLLLIPRPFLSFQSKQATREQESRNRDQLLQMRFTTNAAAASSGVGGEGTGGALGSDTSILIDRALEHNSALNVRLFGNEWTLFFRQF